MNRYLYIDAERFSWIGCVGSILLDDFDPSDKDAILESVMNHDGEGVYINVKGRALTIQFTFKARERNAVGIVIYRYHSATNGLQLFIEHR